MSCKHWIRPCVTMPSCDHRRRPLLKNRPEGYRRLVDLRPTTHTARFSLIRPLTLLIWMGLAHWNEPPSDWSRSADSASEHPALSAHDSADLTRLPFYTPPITHHTHAAHSGPFISLIWMSLGHWSDLRVSSVDSLHLHHSSDSSEESASCLGQTPDTRVCARRTTHLTHRMSSN